MVIGASRYGNILSLAWIGIALPHLRDGTQSGVLLNSQLLLDEQVAAMVRRAFA